MYQTADFNRRKEDFNKLIDTLSSAVKHDVRDKIETSEEIWDLHAVYFPTYIREWNRKKHLGSKCRIISKNNKFALVRFFKPLANTTSLQCIYALEDLYIY